MMRKEMSAESTWPSVKTKWKNFMGVVRGMFMSAVKSTGQ